MPRFTDIASVHLVGIGGTGMGAFAGLLRSAGYAVRGSDAQVYPPMSDKLREWGIPYAEGYGPQNLQPAPDLVVIGNVIRAANPEAAWARDQALNQASFPETLGALFLEQRHSVVVAGTHGKTTTSLLCAHVLQQLGLDPSYLIGGVPQGGGEPFHLGAGPHFVVEGDEYDTVYWDKGPKFLHYRPRTAVLTSVEFDHADIYPDLDAVDAAFRKLVQLIPPEGLLVCAAKHPGVRRAAAHARCQVLTYGDGQGLSAAEVREDAAGLRFEIRRDGAACGAVSVPLSGPHGVENTLAAYGVATALGGSHPAVAAALRSFPGARRRLELRGEAGGVQVLDDFAHHPTAVRVTLEGARQRFAGQRLWALFEPRSASAARRVFQEDFAQAFDAADRVVIARSGRHGQLPPEQALDEQKLVDDLNARGIAASYGASVEAIVAQVAAEARPGDVVIAMSNGAFGGIHELLLDALQRQ